MITFNPNSMCEQARAYYYEYLCGEAQEHIPAEVLDHISQCRFCQAEVNRLEIILAERERTKQTNSIITTNLRLHFAYIGALVTCNTLRPFLPSLADLALEMGYKEKGIHVMRDGQILSI